MDSMKKEQEDLEKCTGIKRGPDGKIMPPVPANCASPPQRLPDGSVVPGGAIIKGPDGKILRIISASGVVRGSDGKIISFRKPVKVPPSRSPITLIEKPIPCRSQSVHTCISHPITICSCTSFRSRVC